MGGPVSDSRVEKLLAQWNYDLDDSTAATGSEDLIAQFEAAGLTVIDTDNEGKRRELIQSVTHKLYPEEGKTLHHAPTLAIQVVNWIYAALRGDPR